MRRPQHERLGQASVALRCAPRLSPAAGTRAGIGYATCNLHSFDAASGHRTRRGSALRPQRAYRSQTGTLCPLKSRLPCASTGPVFRFQRPACAFDSCGGRRAVPAPPRGGRAVPAPRVVAQCPRAASTPATHSSTPTGPFMRLFCGALRPLFHSSAQFGAWPRPPTKLAGKFVTSMIRHYSRGFWPDRLTRSRHTYGCD